MNVASILSEKGNRVISENQNAKLYAAVATLDSNRVGCLCVLDDNRELVGVLSERDIVRRIARDGRDILDQPVHEVMVREVKTCQEQHTLTEVMEFMTEGRFRHMPVTRNGKLVGIISIGDVVKHRIEEAELAAASMQQYIATG